ncbi:MAG: 4Fe-4S dicluster domain-containing protein [Oscillospiraceae bacterium]
MKLTFSFDAEKCSACGACSIACMDQNDIDVLGGQQPYRWVYRVEQEGAAGYYSTACLHCDDAPCIPACPMDCLYKDEATSLTLADTANCIGCKACLRVCPVDAPTFRPTGESRPRFRMEKCDGCHVRVEAGLEPACVRACPTGALTWAWK